jgi:hypothetical protein
MTGFLSIIAALGLVFGAVVIGDATSKEVEIPGILGGAALLLGGWFAARYQNGASSVNNIGTGYFGGIDSTRGWIMTKWICVIIPVIPVRSYVVLSASEDSSDYTSTTTMYRTIALPGLGLWWPSVGKTILWTGVALGVIALIVYLVG